MALYALMPVYNELNRYLPDVVEHVLNIVDELFVYDDRSTDGSYDAVMDMGVTCAQRGTDIPGFVEHEGRYRQWGWEAFESAMQPQPGDWVLANDADEKLYGTKNLRDLFHLGIPVLGVDFVHMWNPTHYRVDKMWKRNTSSRLFRYREGGEFKQTRLASGSEPTYVADAIRAHGLPRTGLLFQHLGYMRDEDKQAKYKRYSQLDGGEFHAGAHIESILDPNPELVEWRVP